MLRTRRNLSANLSICLPNTVTTNTSTHFSDTQPSVSHVPSMDSMSSAKTQESSTWFNNLPDKVQRARFSPEELAQFSPSSVNLLPTRSTSFRNQRITRMPSNDEQFLNCYQCSPIVLGMRKDDRSRLESMQSPRTAIGYTTASDRTPRQYTRNLPCAEDNQHAKPHFQNITQRRPTSVLLEQGLRRSSSMASISQLSPSATSRGSIVQQHTPLSPIVNIVNSPSQYYQDPDARMKLKVYLASPQKFDEVLEHGFPSARQADQQRDLPKPTHRVVRDRTAINDYQTFLKYDTLAFLDDEEQKGQLSLEKNEDFTFFDALDGISETGIEDDADHRDQDDVRTLSHIDSPRTPLNDQSFPAARDRWAPESVSSSSCASPLPLWTGNREMTLRMTLTKPELRAKDDDIYGWQQVEENEVVDEGGDPLKVDLLALEPLPVMHDHSAFRTKPVGSRNNQEGKVAQIWWERFKQRTLIKSMKGIGI